jgi:hypothetical protein
MRTCFILCTATVGDKMRSSGATSDSLFSCVDPEEGIPARHQLRKIRKWSTTRWPAWIPSSKHSLAILDAPSIPPKRLIRTSLLQILFSIRSERQLMEQMGHNQMFR